ncbi:Uncharacterised protein [Mycobacteroides abscessus subsp. abscessus]|uniref:conjugal transfer protein n=1 Tax=Mycobacteroides abscessus TaxID=36809 RepID=UPI0009284DE2|nr:conjugal transfer protein [Mycobacteroides abscessus]SIL99624.1 Uncharacterised protein [Mycobacteroides abscessus subsp. abscessus]SLC79147.1 Uncharacterised protein [Mycobacteroides abscessus subsp. abscessus]
MFSNLGKLFRISEWKPKARERGLVFSIISGPLALLLVVLMVSLMARIMSNLPKPVDTYKAITEVTRVQNYARNSLLLWMGGSSSAQVALMARSSASQTIELSKVPFEVRSIDPSDIVRFQGANAVEWQATFAVTFVAPGSNSAQINRFLLTILDEDGNYQMLLWPSIVNPDTQPFKVASKYTVPVDSNGSLSQSLGRFVTAYLTSTGGATSLGQYVSSKFTGSAIADSPYSLAEIQEIKASTGSPLPGDAEPGTELKVLVKVKASASLDTWSVMHLPLRVTLGSNKVWLVDGIDAPVGWGAIAGR